MGKKGKLQCENTGEKHIRAFIHSSRTGEKF